MKLGTASPQLCFYFKVVLASIDHFHMSFRISLPIFIKRPAGTLISIALTREMRESIWGENWYLTIFESSDPWTWHMLPLYLGLCYLFTTVLWVLTMYQILYKCTLCLSSYLDWPWTFFVRFTPKYFHILIWLQRVLLVASIKGFLNLWKNTASLGIFRRLNIRIY